ncbi:MAG: hypothetical protein KJZ69_15765 [Phycisphaerales bacterium]|nr:hypothetical protein [Phycisphaerales bacterium]
MSQSQRRFLKQLLIAGVDGLPASAVPRGCLGILTDLQVCGVTGHRPSGRGSVIYLSDPAAFERFVTSKFPLGLDTDPRDVEDRASGVQLFGDAKAAKRGRYEGVFIRSTAPRATLVSDNGVLPVSELTALAGGAALCLSDTHDWSFHGTVAVIENAEAFWQHERVLSDVDLAVFACGRLSERVLAWLASEGMSMCRLVQWGDYDPVGCLEYLRLRARCGDRTRMHLPPSVAELLPRYGKRQLIVEQVAELHALRMNTGDEAISALLRLFDRHGKGLEQEALLMSRGLARNQNG